MRPRAGKLARRNILRNRENGGALSYERTLGRNGAGEVVLAVPYDGAGATPPGVSPGAPPS